MARKSPRTDLLILIFCFVSLGSLRSQSIGAASYPEIKLLSNRDVLFAQLSEDVARFHVALAGNEEMPQLLFFRYTVQPDQDLYSIAARSNIGVSALATLNGLTHPETISVGTELLLPNMPGVFVPLNPENDLERMLYALQTQRSNPGIEATIRYPRRRQFIFFPDEKFHPMERAYFLNILFRFPLREGQISSNYGLRIHPISGTDSFHSGIDIAAPAGSAVLAARDGRVRSTGWSDELGNYIVLDHGGGFMTVYGHLETVTVTLSQQVNSGTLIGTVGSTGLSTGPHLHFEVRNAGDLRDPIPLIRGRRE